MRHANKKLLLAGPVFILTAAAHSAFGQTPSAANPCEPPPLQPVERELSGGESDCFKFDLPKGHFFRVRAEQRGVDVTLGLYDSKGGTVGEVDSPNGSRGPEILTVIVPETDVYRLEVKATNATAAKGRYAVVQEALRPASEGDRKQAEGEATFARGQNTAEPAAALVLFQKAADLFQASGDTESAAKAFFEAGYLSINAGDKNSALSFYEKALALFRAVPNRLEEARTLTFIGGVYLASGEHREAIKHFQQADPLFDDSHRLEKADLAHGMGQSYLRLSEPEKALETLARALELFKAVPLPLGEVITLSDIGSAQLELAQKQKALKSFQDALEIAGKHNLRKEEVVLLNNIGRAHDDLGQIEQAREKFTLALLKTEDKQAKASLTLNLGKTYLDLGNSQEALGHFENSLKMFEEAGDRFGKINAVNAAGKAHSKLGDKQKALEHYGLALLLYRDFGSKRGEAVASSNLMSVWQSLGNRRLAIFFGKQSVNVSQHLRASARRVDDESQRSFTATVENTYRTLAALLLEENRVSEAQEVLGLLKQHEFSRFTRPSQNPTPGPAREVGLNDEEKEAARQYKGFEDEVKQLMREMAALEPQGQALPPERRAEIQRRQDELNRRSEKFLRGLAERFGTRKEAAAAESPNALTRVWQERLAELGDGVVLVTTLLTESYYYLIVTTARSQTSYSKEIRRAELGERLKRLNLLLRDPRAKNFLPDAQEIYKILVEPIAPELQQLNAKTLLLSLDGELRYVPFAALHDGRNFLVEKYASVVVTLAQPPDNRRASPETWRALGAGVSKKIGDHDPLPRVPGSLSVLVADNTKKGRKAKGLFPGRILLDEGFTRSSFVAALKQKPQLVHLETHFRLGFGPHADSYLLLGDGDKLNLAELQSDKGTRYDLSGVDLLTLSACETGARDANDANGVEIENLGVTAQRTGAKTVLASLWFIADNRTPELMEEFYRRYKGGRGAISKAEALRHAQIKISKQRVNAPRDKSSHPAYWGAFIVLGNP